ncbi:MAG: glycine zipper 2TM domain-containing protein [Steroidobacteraceae bacterium]
MKCLVLRGLRMSLMTLLVVMAGSVLADPPPHAKAHGWRKKNDPTYVGYTGHQWERDYGVLEGKCNRKEIGTVLGAVVGGAVGSQVGDGSSRAVAIIVGSVLGAAIGREIGRKFDDRDRACFGHALELTEEGHSVRWLNEKTGVTYLLEPHGKAQSGGTCRTYKLTASKEGKSESNEGRACRSDDGTWTKV